MAILCYVAKCDGIEDLQVRKVLWDDAAFKRWVMEGARNKGVPVAQVLEEAGCSPFYLKLRGKQEGRSTNIIMNLAEILGQSPAELLDIHMPELEERARLWSKLPRAVDEARKGRVVLASRVIAAQLAVLLYTVSERADTDPAALLELIMREMNKRMNGTENSPAKDATAE